MHDGAFVLVPDPKSVVVFCLLVHSATTAKVDGTGMLE